MRGRHGIAGHSAERRTHRRARDEVPEEGPRREQHVPHRDAAAVADPARDAADNSLQSRRSAMK
jgi:hypothetical protein